MKEHLKDHLNVIILAVAILMAMIIYCFFTWNLGRYQIVRTNEWGFANEIDTKTGEAWMLVGTREGPKKRKYEEVLPFNPADYSPLPLEKKPEH